MKPDDLGPKESTTSKAFEWLFMLFGILVTISLGYGLLKFIAQLLGSFIDWGRT